MLSVTAIVAAAGGAPNQQPSWTLVLPDGRPAIASVIQRLDFKNVSRFIFVCLKAHVLEYCPAANVGGGGDDAKHLSKLIEEVNPQLRDRRVDVLMLDSPTSSAVETVSVTIEKCKVQGAIFVKDADGAFDFQIPDASSGGSYCVAMQIDDGNVHTLSDLTRKSFVQQCGGQLTNIVEKKIISDTICVGGYGFESAQTYIETGLSLSKIKDPTGAVRRPLFNSDILLYMMAEQQCVVRCLLVKSFCDWKSPAGVSKYVRSFQNLVVSLEDELCERARGSGFVAIELSAAGSATSTSTLASSEVVLKTQLQALFVFKPKAVEELRERRVMGRCKIVILTALPAAVQPALQRFLTEAAVPYDSIVCGMFAGNGSHLSLK